MVDWYDLSKEESVNPDYWNTPLGIIQNDINKPVEQHSNELWAKAQQDAERENQLSAYLDDMVKNVPQIDPNMGNQEIRNNTQRLVNILGMTTPQMDAQKAERLKRIAAINAGGQALTAAFSGIMGAKHGVVLKDDNQITPKALAEYSTMIEQDKANKYKTAIMQAQAEMQGLKEEAANTLANKKWNQAQQAKTTQMLQKFNLDRYINDEKYRQGVDKLTTQHGFKMYELAKKNKYDEEKTKYEAEQRLKGIQLRESGAWGRAIYNHDNKPDKRNEPISFINQGTGQLDSISPQAATAIVTRRKAQIENSFIDPENGKMNEAKLQQAATTPGEYQQIVRYLQGGLTVSEKEALMASLYSNKMALDTKQFSKNDMDAAYQRTVVGNSSAPKVSVPNAGAIPVAPESTTTNVQKKKIEIEPWPL